MAKIKDSINSFFNDIAHSPQDISEEIARRSIEDDGNGHIKTSYLVLKNGIGRMAKNGGLGLMIGIATMNPIIGLMSAYLLDVRDGAKLNANFQRSQVFESKAFKKISSTIDGILDPNNYPFLSNNRRKTASDYNNLSL